MRELTTDEHQGIAKLALMVARKTRKQYPMVHIDDLIQESWVWTVTHPKKTREYLEDEDKQRGTRMLVAALKNAVKDYARKERAQRFDYVLEDDVFYSVSMLKGAGRGKGLLHYVYDRDAWLKPPSRDDAPRSAGDAAEGNGWLATLVDVDRALKTLPRAQQGLLEAHFRNGYTYEQIGSSFPVSVSAKTVSLKVDAAVVKLQDALGGNRPKADPPEGDWENGYVGTRRVMSNARARAVTDNQDHERQYV